MTWPLWISIQEGSCHLVLQRQCLPTPCYRSLVDPALTRSFISCWEHQNKENLRGDGGFPGSWKMVLTYKCRESFHKSTHSVFIGVFYYTDPSWGRSLTLPSDLIFTMASLFHQHLRKNYHFKKLSTKALTQMTPKHTVTLKAIQPPHRNTAAESSKRIICASLINLWGIDLWPWKPLRQQWIRILQWMYRIFFLVKYIWIDLSECKALKETNFGFDLYK